MNIPITIYTEAVPMASVEQYTNLVRKYGTVQMTNIHGTLYFVYQSL